ncbi:MAG: hypothetical protein U0670_22580 [Anaerolineae bacterium]
MQWSSDQRYLAVGNTTTYADAADTFIVDVQNTRVLYHWTDGLEGISQIVWSLTIDGCWSWISVSN